MTIALMLIGGLVLLVAGGEFLVRGAAQLAAACGIFTYKRRKVATFYRELMGGAISWRL